MANKKKRRPRNRPRATGGERTDGAPRGGGAPPRRDRKAQARQARDDARRRAQRARALQRAGLFAISGAVAIGVLWWFQRAPAPSAIPQTAVQAAQAAGCTTVQTPVSDPVRTHLQPGESYTYDQHPATSGPHDPSPLPSSPAVYTAPVEETRAVHFLEHAGVILYYRADGDGALPKDVVDALDTVATDRPNTLAAPYPDLPAGQSIALAAWNKLQTCPGNVTAVQATTIANGFDDAFVCTSNAPEPKVSSDC
jgi:hypothetical protein